MTAPREHSKRSSSRQDRALAVLGIAIGIIGIALSIYFYQGSKRIRELSYDVAPNRAVILHAGESDKLSASFAGIPVSTDLSIAQVTIWNSGTEAIRSEHILEHVAIVVGDRARVFEAAIRQVTRPAIVQLRLSDSTIQSGQIGLNWRIMEPGDAAVVQLIYAGNANVPISVVGTIEGAALITQKQYISREELRRRSALLFPKHPFLSVAILLATAFGYGFMIKEVVRRIWYGGRSPRRIQVAWAMLVAATIVLCFLFWQVVVYTNIMIRPPASVEHTGSS